MIPTAKPSTYFRTLNLKLLHSVPDECMNFLDVGCGEGQLGEALKQKTPQRSVIGLECDQRAALIARQKLDEVYVLDIENADPPIAPGTIDCILYGDILEHLKDPETVLRKHSSLLRKGGLILCSVCRAKF